MTTSAEHRAAAEALIKHGTTYSTFEQHTDTIAATIALVHATEEQTEALHALTHAVLALGKTPDGGPFLVVDRDDEG